MKTLLLVFAVTMLVYDLLRQRNVGWKREESWSFHVQMLSKLTTPQWVVVDLVDQALRKFRPAIRGKKLYFPLLVNELNIGIVYAWRLYQIITNKTVPEKPLIRSIVRILLKAAFNRTYEHRQSAGPSVSVPRDIRLDNIGHHPESLETPRRCTYCKENCRIVCQNAGKAYTSTFFFKRTTRK